ncbi:hypothetical protein P9112_008985 [Eukaryota sp. TZLM1-RC]
MIFFDGTHIKTKYKSTMLVATGIDAKGYPLAFGAVRSESISTCNWFMELFKQTFDINGVYIILSDRQNGLMDAIEGVFAEGIHQEFCINHLADNVFKHGDALAVNWLWQLTKIKTVEEFICKMEKCRNKCSKVADYLSKFPVEYWADHAFPEKSRRQY